MTTATAHAGDCLDFLKSVPDRAYNLTFCSPPYERARTYGIGYALKGQAWVDWCVPRFLECLRVTNGLVAWVVEGQTNKYRWSAAPALLMADLHRAGVALRKPPAFHRVGIPGSGGPDWLRNDYEFIVCATNGGKLPWSDNTAMGHPPKWGPGGAMSHRLSSGERVNQWGGKPKSQTNRRANGERQEPGRPSHVFGNKPSEACGRVDYKRTYFNGKGHPGNRLGTRENLKGSIASPGWTRDGPNFRENGDGAVKGGHARDICVRANPGNVIKCIVGGGVMGSKLAHENEAPFPEALAEFAIRSFCPPDGTVFDPFCGSGTTLAVALKHGRNAVGVDIRESQVELTKRRCMEAWASLRTEATAPC